MICFQVKDILNFNIPYTGNRNELKLNEFKFDYDINHVGLLGLKKLNQILFGYFGKNGRPFRI